MCLPGDICLGGSRCTNGRCECSAGENLSSDGRCVRPLRPNDSCMRTDICGGNSSCLRGVCTCPSGHVVRGEVCVYINPGAVYACACLVFPTFTSTIALPPAYHGSCASGRVLKAMLIALANLGEICVDNQNCVVEGSECHSTRKVCECPHPLHFDGRRCVQLTSCKSKHSFL